MLKIGRSSNFFNLPHCGPGVDASDRNKFQKQKSNVSGEQSVAG
jgi:hypothetical protein